MAWHLSKWYGHVILVSRCPVLTDFSWPWHGYAIYQVAGSHMLESARFYIGCPVLWTDGQTEGHTVTWLPNFLRCIDNHIFSAMGPCLHARRAPLIEIVLSFSPKLFQYCHYKDSHHTRCLSLEMRDLSLEMRWVTYTRTCTFEWCYIIYSWSTIVMILYFFIG